MKPDEEGGSQDYPLRIRLQSIDELKRCEDISSLEYLLLKFRELASHLCENSIAGIVVDDFCVTDINCIVKSSYTISLKTKSGKTYVKLE